MVYIVMGVSGCGKTSAGKGLAQKLRLPFYDGDDFHPETNRAKMAAGIALTDEDRFPWLEQLHQLVVQWEHNGGAVLACSALKNSYRSLLRGHLPASVLRFIYLHATPEEVAQRLHKRQHHFFPKELLASQFASLEHPGEAVQIEVAGLSNPQVVDRIIAALP